MKRFVMVFMVLGLIGGSVTTAEAEQTFERTERTVEATYYGAQLFYQERLCAVSGAAGCITLDTLPNESSLTAVALDAYGQPVPVWVVDASERRDELDGANRVYGSFCGHTSEPIRFEPGAKLEFWVLIDWYRLTIYPGLRECNPGVATTGTISVTITGSTTSEEPTSPSPEPAGSPAEEPASPSPEPDESPAPQSSPSGQNAVVERSVDLALRRHLRATGSVGAADPSCRSDVPVVIQRKTSDSWREIASTTTDADGAFAVRLTDRAGRYRALAPEVGAQESTCLVARSAPVRHQH